MALVSTNFITGSDVKSKAGSAYAELEFAPFIGSAMARAEGTVNAAARYDFSSNIAAHTTANGSTTYNFINDIGASLAAVEAITFHINGYPNRIIAEDMINVNRDGALRGLSILRDINTQEWMGIK